MSEICLCGHKKQDHNTIDDMIMNMGYCQYCGNVICPNFVFSFRDTDEFNKVDECEKCHKMSRFTIQINVAHPKDYPPFQLWCLECVRG